MSVAIVLASFTAFGVVGGYLFYPINNKVGMKTFVIGFGICALAYIGIQFAGSLAIYYVISVFFGVGYGMLAPSINYYLGIKIKPQYRAASVAAASLISHLGSFGSPFMMSFFRNLFKSESDRFSFFIGTFFFVFASLFFILHKNTEESFI